MESNIAEDAISTHIKLCAVPVAVIEDNESPFKRERVCAEHFRLG